MDSQFVLHFEARDATRKIKVRWQVGTGSASVYGLLDDNYITTVPVLLSSPADPDLFLTYIDNLNWDALLAGVAASG